MGTRAEPPLAIRPNRMPGASGLITTSNSSGAMADHFPLGTCVCAAVRWVAADALGLTLNPNNVHATCAPILQAGGARPACPSARPLQVVGRCAMRRYCMARSYNELVLTRLVIYPTRGYVPETGWERVLKVLLDHVGWPRWWGVSLVPLVARI